MLKKTRHSNRLEMVALLSMILGAGILFAGCDNASEDESNSVTKVETKEPAESMEAGKARAKETATEKTPLRVELHPPMLHLTMDDNAASPTVLDVSAESHNQTFLDPDGDPNTDAHSVPGVFGMALAFDGMGDSVVIPAAQVSHVFGADADFSVAFWWRSGSDPFPDGYKEVLSNYSPANGGIVLYQRGNVEQTDKRIYMNFYVAGNGAPVLFPFVDVPENTGRWHHYVFQRESSTLRAWRDGRLRGSYTDPVASGSMGSGVDLNINSHSSGAEGALDDLRIYPRALFKSEIRGLSTTRPGAEDLFFLGEKLCDLKANPASAASEIECVAEALKKESKAQKGYPKQIGKNVELLAFRYSFVESDEYEMAFAFRTSAQLDKNYFIHVRGMVDPSHVSKIPMRNGKPSHVQKWEIVPETLTSAWAPGDVIVVRRWVRAAEVPYRIDVNLLCKAEDYAPLVPKYVQLGWHASF
ncbi:LamG domain-containing protein [Candidatus Hydrogenedentota bacterium]